MSYRSTAGMFDDFMKSTIWDDILQEMNDWLEDIHRGLEDPNGETDDKALHRLGGNAETIRNIMKMPEVIRDNIKEDHKEVSGE